MRPSAAHADSLMTLMCRRWHTMLTNVFRACLEGQEWTSRRNALTVMTRLASVCLCFCVNDDFVSDNLCVCVFVCLCVYTYVCVL